MKKLYFLIAFSLIIWNGSPLHSTDASSNNEHEEVKKTTNTPKSILKHRLALYGTLAALSGFSFPIIDNYARKLKPEETKEFMDKSAPFLTLTPMCLGIAGEFYLRGKQKGLKNNIIVATKAIVTGGIGGLIALFLPLFAYLCV